MQYSEHLLSNCDTLRTATQLHHSITPYTQLLNSPEPTNRPKQVGCPIQKCIAAESLHPKVYSRRVGIQVSVCARAEGAPKSGMEAGRKAGVRLELSFSMFWSRTYQFVCSAFERVDSFFSSLIWPGHVASGPSTLSHRRRTKTKSINPMSSAGNE